MSSKMRGIGHGALAAAIAAALGAPATVEAGETSAGAEAALMSAYVWRGQVLNDEPVVQPAVTVGAAGFALNFWGNLNLTDNVNASGEFSEVDITLSYAPSLPIDAWSLDMGVSHYTFPNTIVETEAGAEAAADTTELYAGVSREGVITPSLTVYYDFNQVDGFYLVGSLSYAAPLERLHEALSLELEFATGYGDGDYNQAYFGIDSSKVNDGLVSATLGYAANENLSLSGILAYSWFWDAGIRDAASEIYFDKDQVFGGVLVSYGF